MSGSSRGQSIPRLTEFVYELQFRSTMDKPFKAQALEQLLKLQAKINQPEPAKLPQPSTTLPPPAPDFLFPSTNIASTRKKLMGSRFAGKSWYEVGLLKVSGYSVGITEGKSTKERRSILNWIFLQDELHDIDDPAYASEWGEPKSTTRLQKNGQLPRIVCPQCTTQSTRHQRGSERVERGFRLPLSHLLPAVAPLPLA
ncbi:hypothetical protein [Aeromonas veronii]|uniref:hypothetical protein n=1 Tax=Aeromonas veronii TaxID=654 RepID=UPI003D222954